MEKKRRGPAKGDPRSVAAGKKGGDAVRDKYGTEHLKTIGRKGGKRTLEIYGYEFYSDIATENTGAQKK
jgi:uncharacterized protein